MKIHTFRRPPFFLCLILISSCTTLNPEANVCFTPGGDCLGTIAAEIGRARSDLLIQAHALNAKVVADAVVRAKESGVSVEIILDRSSGVAQNNATYFSSLNGIPAYIDGRHHTADGTVIIIDKETVITGSFNLTKEAQDRDSQNVMILHSDRAASEYINNWNEHKNHSDEFKPRAPKPERHSKIEKKNGKKKKKGL